MSLELYQRISPVKQKSASSLVSSLGSLLSRTCCVLSRPVQSAGTAVLLPTPNRFGTLSGDEVPPRGPVPRPPCPVVTRVGSCSGPFSAEGEIVVGCLGFQPRFRFRIHGISEASQGATRFTLETPQPWSPH